MLYGNVSAEVNSQGDLIITADEKAREDIIDNGYVESDMFEVLEDLFTNQGYSIVPEEGKGLTEAPMIEDENGNVFYFNTYAIEDFVQVLGKHGQVKFIGNNVQESIVEDADNSKLLFSQEKAEAFFTELGELSQYSERTRELFEKIQNIYLELEKEIKSEITSKNRKEEDAFDMKRESVSESKTDMRSFMSIVTESDFQQVKGIKNTVKTTDAMKEKGGKKSNDLMKKV